MNGPFEIEDDRGKFRASPLFKGGNSCGITIQRATKLVAVRNNNSITYRYEILFISKAFIAYRSGFPSIAVSYTD